MGINENQEFEAINQKVKERSENVEEVRQAVADTYREVQARKKARGILCIMVVIAVLAIAVTGFWALEEIEWINHTFRIVLTAAAGAVAMFKVGCFWQKSKP
jgi:type II secretory pathway component PulM